MLQIITQIQLGYFFNLILKVVLQLSYISLINEEKSQN